ncbi:hypothetical protein, partial [Schleiferia thermophila]
MKRYILFFIALHFSFPGSAQHQAKQWIFGQGLGMDFTTPQVSFFNVPYIPNEPNHRDYNQSSVYCDEKGEILLYFLNGKYYDKNNNIISGGEVYEYKFSPNTLLFGENKTSFFINFSNNKNVIFHYYVYGEPENISTKNHSIRLNKITLNNSTIISIDSIDTYNNSNPVSFINRANSGINLTPISSKGNIFFMIDAPGTNKAVIIVKIDSTGFQEILNHNIIRQNNTSLFPEQLFFFHPLTETFFILGKKYDSNGIHHTFLERFKHQNNFNFSINPTNRLFFPLKPGINNQNTQAFIKYCITLQGRYIYMFGSWNNQLFIERADLFAKDSLAFYNSHVQIPLPQPLQLISSGTTQYWLDSQVGPDGNIYFMLAKRNQISLTNQTPNNPENKFLCRIINPEDSDINNVQIEMNFHTFPDWSLFASFPGLSTNQLMPPPFEVLSSCSDSVHLDLNYKNIIDSVWWDFGDPVGLGTANNSSVVSPVIKYPNYGKYYVSVQLWFDGDT